MAKQSVPMATVTLENPETGEHVTVRPGTEVEADYRNKGYTKTIRAFDPQKGPSIVTPDEPEETEEDEDNEEED